MDDSRKHLPYAPYLMYMIERVTKITFKKDVKHEPVHLSSRDADALPSSRHRSSSSSAPVVDDPPIPIPYRAPSDAPSSSRRHGNRSMIKRVLHSIFCMCQTMVKEVNENRRDMIEIKSHLGLPCDPYHELPDFDDPFAERDAQETQVAQANVDPAPHAPAPRTRAASHRSRHTHGDDDDTEEEILPQYHEHDDEEDDTEEDDNE